jgi:hypothetical protein
MAIAYSILMAASLSWNPNRVVVAKRVRTLDEALVAPTPGERAGLDPSKEIVVPAPNSAASVVSATLLEPEPEEMPQIDHSLMRQDEEPVLPIEKKKERRTKTPPAVHAVARRKS